MSSLGFPCSRMIQLLCGDDTHRKSYKANYWVAFECIIATLFILICKNNCKHDYAYRQTEKKTREPVIVS